MDSVLLNQSPRRSHDELLVEVEVGNHANDRTAENASRPVDVGDGEFECLPSFNR